MPRGTVFQTERIERYDATTGLLVRQVTSFPTTHLHMHYETPTFTPDVSKMIVVSQRKPMRGAPHDLLALGSDGMNPTQMNSDTPEGASNCCIAIDGKFVLYMEGTTAHRTSLDGKDDVELGRVDGATPHDYYRGSRTCDGRWYFSMVRRNGKIALVRWDLKTGGYAIAVEADGINHPQMNPGGPEFRVGLKYNDATKKGKSGIHADTLELIDLTFPNDPYGTAHTGWLGRTGKIHGTSKPPGRMVMVLERGAAAPDVIAEGPYFWHSGASEDGEWVVADSNWPDEGLWLINVATKKRELLCFGHSSQGHPQRTHLHANLSEHAEFAVFDSDRTGITQVYVVTIPPEMRERLRKP